MSAIHWLMVAISLYLAVNSAYKFRTTAGDVKEGWLLSMIGWTCVALLEAFHHLPSFLRV